MAATDGNPLAWLQLGGRHTEDDGAAEQRRTRHLHLTAQCSVTGGLVGSTIQVVGQRTIAPLVWEDIVLRRVEMVDARNLVPFAAQHVTIGVLHLIIIYKV